MADLTDRPFTHLIPEAVLYEMDSPMIFSMNYEGRTLLAYMCDEAPGLSRFIVVPTDSTILTGLRNGTISVRTALEQPWVWCVDADPEGAVVHCLVTSIDELPNDLVPNHGVYLYSRPHVG